MAQMHCPFCNTVNDVRPRWGVLLRCKKCRLLSHPDRWTYTTAEWKKRHEVRR